MNKHMRRGEAGDAGWLIVCMLSCVVGFVVASFGFGGIAYESGVKDAASGKAVVRTLPDGTLKVYRASEVKDMPAIGSIVTFEPSPLESGVRVTEGRVHKTDGRYVHIRPLLNGVEQAEFWKLTPCEILRVKEGK